jgi:hypothetical protein
MIERAGKPEVRRPFSRAETSRVRVLPPRGYHNGTNVVTGTVDVLDEDYNTLASLPVTITVNASGL